MADRPEVTDYNVAGEYMRKLAMGEEPIPTPGDVKQKLSENSVEVPNGVTASLTVDTPNNFNVMIRDSAAITDDWNAINDPNGEYIFPEGLKTIYAEFFDDPDAFKGPGGLAKRRELFRARLADYSFGSCAG